MIFKKSVIVFISVFLLVACSEQATATIEKEKVKSTPKAPVSKPSPQSSPNLVKSSSQITGIKIMWQTATVKYMQLEGGFWGLVTDKGQQLLPMNLAKEFRQINAVVKFRGHIKNDVMTIQQWGTPFEITEMTLIKAGIPVDNKNNPLL